MDPSIKEHGEYLDKITDDAERKLKQLIDDIIAADKKKKSDPVKDEIGQHLLFCQTKCADFKGKEDTLEVGNSTIWLFLCESVFEGWEIRIFFNLFL